VLRGALELRRDGTDQNLPAGTAFHVPAGQPAHRFAAAERTVFAGVVPIGGSVFGAPLAYGTAPDSDEAAPADDMAGPVLVRLMAGAASVPVRSGSIEAEAAAMGDLVVTRVAFGRMSGYGTAWCDAPHWGMVLTGGMGIEWEHDVEVLTAGDVFYCPAGPPGHRLEVADSAVVVDFTPREALRTAGRIADWRPRVDQLEAARPG
jgi:quercetin dioxygenase-like cupin family protein